MVIKEEDRLAAARLIEAYYPSNKSMLALAAAYRNGHSQGVWVNSFATHRQSAELPEIVHTSVAKSGALLPCPNPWCVDNQPDLIQWGRDSKWRVECDCGINPGDSATEAEAIIVWNTRPTLEDQVSA